MFITTWKYVFISYLKIASKYVSCLTNLEITNGSTSVSFEWFKLNFDAVLLRFDAEDLGDELEDANEEDDDDVDIEE